MNNIIVVVAQGKGNDRAHAFAVKLFSTIEEANTYIERVTFEGKYWVVAGKVEDGKAFEIDSDGIYDAFLQGFVEGN